MWVIWLLAAMAAVALFWWVCTPTQGCVADRRKTVTLAELWLRTQEARDLARSEVLRYKVQERIGEVMAHYPQHRCYGGPVVDFKAFWERLGPSAKARLNKTLVHFNRKGDELPLVKGIVHTDNNIWGIGPKTREAVRSLYAEMQQERIEAAKPAPVRVLKPLRQKTSRDMLPLEKGVRALVETASRPDVYDIWEVLWNKREDRKVYRWYITCALALHLVEGGAKDTWDLFFAGKNTYEGKSKSRNGIKDTWKSLALTGEERTQMLEYLLEYAQSKGLILTLAEEMAIMQATSPLNEHGQDHIVAVSEKAAQVLEELGHTVMFRAGDTRIIFGQWPKEFVFFGGKQVPTSKALKGKKYAKALVAPANAYTEVNVTAADCLDQREFVEEAAIDGQVLLAESVFKAMLRDPRTRPSFKRKLGKGPHVGRVFVGRLFVPGLGLIKGGFVVVPDSWLYSQKLERQFAVAYSEVKTEVTWTGEKALLLSMSNVKKTKIATTDLQNFLMSIPLQDARSEALIRRVIDAQKHRRTNMVQSWMDKIRQDKGVETEDATAQGLKELAIAEVFAQTDIPVEAVPSLYAGLMSLAGDGHFDPERFRLHGELMDGNQPKAWRYTAYLQPHPGRFVLAFEQAHGKLNISQDERDLLESWSELAPGEILSPKLYEATEAWDDEDVYVTRRPMTLTSGVEAEIVGFDTKWDIHWVRPTPDVKNWLLDLTEGADFDDAFEVNLGPAGALMSLWHERKAKLVQLEQLHTVKERVMLFLDPTGLRVYHGEDDDVVDSWVNDAAKASYQAMKVQFELGSGVGDHKLWTQKTLLDDISAWTGSAANAQMWASFILQGFGPQDELTRELAKLSTSLMLSDVIDATNQANNVWEAAETMRLLIAMTVTMRNQIDEDGDVENIPVPMASRAMWAMKDRMFSTHVGDTQWVKVGHMNLPAKEKTVTPRFTGEWPMFDQIMGYIAWFEARIKEDLSRGQATGHMSRMAGMATQDLISDKQLANVLHSLGRAQRASIERSKLLMRTGADSESLQRWAKAPIDEMMIHILKDEQLAYKVMLAKVTHWAKFDAQELKVSIDPKTQGVKLAGAGDRTALYGDIQGHNGLWRYFASWVKDKYLSGKKEADTVCLYRRGDTEELLATIAGDTLADLVSMGFKPVNGDDDNAGNINRVRTSLSRKDKAGSMAWYNQQLERKVVSITPLHSARFDTWQLSVTLE